MPRFNSTLSLKREPINIDDCDFGEWHVLYELPRDPVFPERRRWLCKCSCGTIKPVQQSSLLYGKSLSCGHERRQDFVNKTRKHGLRRKPIYMRWWSMLRRCHDENVKSYPRYGGRGIVVCDGWHEFENFFSDMGHAPEGMSLDRINNDGNYSCGKCDECRSKNWPMNVQWADKYQQGDNKSQTRFLTINGVRKPVNKWGRENGLKGSTIRDRIDRYGWTEAQAVGLEPPPPKIGRRPNGTFLPATARLPAN